jgi:hypothetical protein
MFMSGTAELLPGKDAKFSRVNYAGQGARPSLAEIFDHMGDATERKVATDRSVGRLTVRFGSHAQNHDAIRDALQSDGASKSLKLVLVGDLAGKQHFGKLPTVQGEFALAYSLKFAHDLETLPRIGNVPGENLEHVRHLCQLRLGDDGNAVIGPFQFGHIDVRLILEHGLHPGEALSSWRLGKNLAAEESAQVATITYNRHGYVRQADVAGIDLGASRGAAAGFRRIIAMGAGTVHMGAEAVHQVAEQRARGSANLAGARYRMKLHQSVASGEANGLFWFEQFKVFGPHKFDVPNGAGVVEKYKYVLEEF